MTTMQIDRATVEQALEALEFLSLDFFMLDPLSPGRESTIKAITALRAALAQQAEPNPDYPCRSDGRCQYAIDHGAEGLGSCPKGKCAIAQPQPAEDRAVAQDNLRVMREMFGEQAEPVEPVAWVNQANLASARLTRDRGGQGDTHTWSETRSNYHGVPLYTAPPQRVAQQAEPLNLRDPAVQKRLATQWGYVPAAQAEPVEPVAQFDLNTMPGQADAHLRALLRYTENFYATAIEHGMRAGPTANAIAHVERAGKALHQIVHAQAKMLEPAQPVEPVEPVAPVDPVAVVATQSDVWRGYNGQWAPPGEPTKMVQMLRDLPMGTLLYTALAQQANHLTIERLRDALVASRIIDPAAVEDPDGYDDGVALHRIDALHRRLT